MAAPLKIPRKGTADSHQQQRRSPSPLRQSTSFDHDHWDAESASSSLGQLANSLAQRVGGRHKSGSLPTDAELEAEAARAREESRREAERILTQEAEERRLVEDRLRGLLDSTRHSPIAQQPLSTSPGPTSPLQVGSSPRDNGSWWAMAKAKFTPTKDKDPLTPAQQLVQDTRNKEKKDKKSREQNKLPDPSYLNLNSSRPYTPSPSQSPIFTTPTKGPNAFGGTPNSFSTHLPDEQSLYIQKSLDGSLDVSSTLIGIARRFEKLEKWAVSHVRALEERMSDVERWLVEKEEERERDQETMERRPSKRNDDIQAREPSIPLLAEQISDMKHDLSEIQTRVGVLGREVAKLAVTSPQMTPVRTTNPSPVTPGPPKSKPTELIALPITSSAVAETTVRRPQKDADESAGIEPEAKTAELSQEVALPSCSQDKAKPRSLPPKPSKTIKPENDPDVSPSTISTYTARTKLPYPTGDYTSQPTSPASPTLSPRNSIRSQNQISGLPQSPNPFESSQSPIPSGIPSMLPPKSFAGSSSPTPAPRKRYTVALGKPINSPPPSETGSTNSFGTQLERAFSRDTPDFGLAVLATEQTGSRAGETSDNESTSKAISKPSLNRSRLRPQSSYGTPSPPTLGPTAPLRPRVRSKSTDKIGLSNSLAESFRDPYLERIQAREHAGATRTPVTTGRQKVPIDQLVKFFDGGN